MYSIPRKAAEMLHVVNAGIGLLETKEENYNNSSQK